MAAVHVVSSPVACQVGLLRNRQATAHHLQGRKLTAAGRHSYLACRRMHPLCVKIVAAASPEPPYSVVITGSTKACMHGGNQLRTTQSCSPLVLMVFNAHGTTAAVGETVESEVYCRHPLTLAVMIRGRRRCGVAGVGRALASAFLEAGDNVCVCSRSDARVSEAVKGLQADVKQKGGGGTVKGIAANVAKPADVAQLGRFAVQQFGGIDLWINNAGSNAYSYVPLAENNVQDLISIVETNTLGTMLCCREAIRIMRDQPTGGHVFLMDGAGADGGATPRFAAYGSTKRGLAQFQKSLSAELKLQNLSNVHIHNLSPGMVTTELLMAGADSSKVSRFFINCLAEKAEDVAQLLVPQIRKVPQESAGKSVYIRALTKPKAYGQIIQRLLTGARKSRFVAEQ